jgi:hypothetical protein
MRSFPNLLILGVVAMVLAACSNEQFSRNVFEGIEAHNESYKSTPLEKSKGDGLSYDQYEKQRKTSTAVRSE